MKKIILQSKQELKIFMDPIRQEIMQRMSTLQEPLTAKNIADMLHIAPSSAKHHLEKLRSIGIVYIHHTETIHGIVATFYNIEDVDVTLGEESKQYYNEKAQIKKILVHRAFDNCYDTIEYYRKKDELVTDEHTKTDQKQFHAQMTSSTIFLTQEEADELQELVTSYLHSHGEKLEGKIPFAINIIAYDAREREK